MKSLKYLNKYFYKYRWRLFLGILFVGISNYFGVKGITLTGESLDIVKEYLRNNPEQTEAGKSALMAALSWQFFLIIIWAIISGIFLFLTRQTIIVLSRLIEYDMKNEVFAHYQHLDISFYKRNSTGDLMNRISEDVSKVRMYTGPAIMYFIGTFFSFCFTIYEMRAKDPTLAFYTLLPLPILAVSIYFISDRIFKKNTHVQEQLSDITTQSQETFSGIRVLKAFGREENSLNDFEKKSTEYRDRTMKLVKTEALFQPFVAALIGLSVIMTIYFGSLQYFNGIITIGSIATFLLFINRLTWPIASLGWVTSLIQRAASSQTRINEFLETASEIKNENTAESEISGKIEFRNVSFQYPDSGIQALDDVSFRIEPGTSLAIVGRTGSGKSTIAALLCRLYDTNKGKILIDGINIREHDLRTLRQSTGYVPQEVFLFSDTIAHNIAFSVNQNEINSARIEEAAKDSAIYENILEFPEGFNTIVGERGITLSGGQKQRISIARAIIKDPKILIFDDCLSAVDTETEEKILNSLKKRMKNRTSLIISHRVSSVKNADLIIVMENGKIIERGIHQELLAAKGSYFRLYQMQLLEQQADLQPKP
ncbi:MAG: ABC transporter ATP-binding protein/permease [Bacteroidota bacterium]|nr:ABC transporter ATP-binding protein/permease [Bacteroidota bacterium]